mmetsp:Transcript_7697/g.19171  ORF Transcript_7697/g.19171 Transcript_7697/m.19171 type:complete len:101 (-) Transcript_7697:696-998(-)
MLSHGGGSVPYSSSSSNSSCSRTGWKKDHENERIPAFSALRVVYVPIHGTRANHKSRHSEEIDIVLVLFPLVIGSSAALRCVTRQSPKAQTIIATNRFFY